MSSLLRNIHTIARASDFLKIILNGEVCFSLKSFDRNNSARIVEIALISIGAVLENEGAISANISIRSDKKTRCTFDIKQLSFPDLVFLTSILFRVWCDRGDPLDLLNEIAYSLLEGDEALGDVFILPITVSYHLNLPRTNPMDMGHDTDSIVQLEIFR